MRHQHNPGVSKGRLRGAAAPILAVGAIALVGCPETRFPDEGAGQPTDRASGKAPPGSVGACKKKASIRPPIVNPEVWEHLRTCNSRTPRRYLRIGYGDRRVEEEKKKDEHQMKLVLEAVTEAHEEQEDDNERMVDMLEEIHRIAEKDPELRPRLERRSNRTCDYAYLFDTTSRAYEKVSEKQDPCPAYVYDPAERSDACLFDTSHSGTKWLTSAWSCLAFTETAGEGGSCYRLCDYDDYCASQVGCAQPDFDLMMCAMGICMPQGVAAFY